jgi:hypothetical protein
MPLLLATAAKEQILKKKEFLNQHVQSKTNDGFIADLK